MNTYRNLRAILGVGLIVAALTAAAPVVRADATDMLLARSKQFQLENGEAKTVIRRGKTKEYRVCMEDGPKAVPLKVSYDGGEAVIAPGECRMIQARNIKLGIEGRLHKDMTLIGRFNPGSKKTSVSVARTAGIKEEEPRQVLAR